MTILSELQTRNITHFLALYEHGRFSEAANALAITQPALSNSIKVLEQRLGHKLFNRTTQGVEATVYGDAFYRRALIVSNELQQAIDDLQLIDEGNLGSLNIGAGPSVIDILSQVISRIVADKPNLKLTLNEGHEQTLLAGLRSGELDIVISTISTDTIEQDLQLEVITHYQTVAIVRKDHPLTKTSKVNWEQLTDYPWVVSDTRLEPLDRQIYEKFTNKKPPNLIVTNSTEFMRSLVMHSNFVTAMPSIMVAGESYKNELTIVGPKDGIIRADICIINRTNSYLLPIANEFISEFKKYITTVKHH